MNRFLPRSLVVFLGLALSVTFPDGSLVARAEETRETLLSELEGFLVKGQVEAARRTAEEALLGFEENGDRRGEATCLVFLALQDAPQGDDERAIARLARSLELLQALDHAFAAAAVARFLGGLLRNRDRFARAEQTLRRGLELLARFESSAAPIPDVDYWLYASMLGLPSDLVDLDDPFSVATRAALVRTAEGALRDSLGETLTWLDRFDEADVELGRALSLMPDSRPRNRAEAFVHLGLLRQEQGRFEEARGSFEKALAIFSGSAPEADGCLGSVEDRVGVYELIERLETVRGDPADAVMRNAATLREARERGDALAEAMLLKSRAALLASIGDFAGSREAVDHAWQVSRAVAAPYLEARILTQQAEVALATGAFELAASSLEQAIPRLQEEGKPHAELMAWSLLAVAYQGLGAHARAARAVDEAGRLSEHVYFPEGRSAARLAEILQRQPTGVVAAREAGPLIESLGLDPGAPYRPSDSVKALIGALRRQVEGAGPDAMVSAAQTALAAARREVDPRWEAMARVVLGAAFREQGWLRLARRQWRKAVRLLRQLGSRHVEAQALAGLADLASAEGRPRAAVSLAIEAIDVFEETFADVRVDALFIRFTSGGQDLYRRAVIALLATGQADAAFAVSERARARALLRQLDPRALRAKQPANAPLVAELTALRSRLAQLETRLDESFGREVQAIGLELETARRRYEDLLVRIQLLEPEVAETVDPRPADLETLQGTLLPPETTLISFFVLPDRVAAWVVDRERFVYVPTSMTAEDLDQVSCFVAGIVEAGRQRGVRRLERCRDATDLAQDFYAKLLAPLMPYVRHRRLVLVPHGPLHALPFAALQDPASRRYLVEDFTLAFSPSVSALSSLRREAVSGFEAEGGR